MTAACESLRSILVAGFGGLGLGLGLVVGVGVWRVIRRAIPSENGSGPSGPTNRPLGGP